jgi:hypothetical protein
MSYYDEIIRLQADKEKAEKDTADAAAKKLQQPLNNSSSKSSKKVEGVHFTFGEGFDQQTIQPGRKIDDVIQYMAKRMKYHEVAVAQPSANLKNADEIIGPGFTNNTTINIMKSK